MVKCVILVIQGWGKGKWRSHRTWSSNPVQVSNPRLRSWKLLFDYQRLLIPRIILGITEPLRARGLNVNDVEIFIERSSSAIPENADVRFLAGRNVITLVLLFSTDASTFSRSNPQSSAISLPILIFSWATLILPKSPQQFRAICMIVRNKEFYYQLTVFEGNLRRFAENSRDSVVEKLSIQKKKLVL
ncbi:unnamed protein product [Haemonchus placei]|uniref:Uncharacterized protein n=1 Tax=Haemonchus placei TaxID=6290 RepID=A0A158QQ38_HAEPC|nr:unnamed protein product [Haemonchus placei]